MIRVVNCLKQSYSRMMLASENKSESHEGANTGAHMTLQEAVSLAISALSFGRLYSAVWLENSEVTIPTGGPVSQGSL